MLDDNPSISTGRMRILIADDHPLIVAGLRDALEADEGFEIVGATSSAPEVLPLVHRTKPDVILLDLHMPGIYGLSCLDRIAARYPDSTVIIFSASADRAQIQTAFNHGASGYIVKGLSTSDLPAAIRRALESRSYQVEGLTKLQDLTLTERELTIVKAVARGLPNQGIAKELWVTEQTVKFHLTNIYRKLGVGNRTEAARWAHSQGFVEPPASITSA